MRGGIGFGGLGCAQASLGSQPHSPPGWVTPTLCGTHPHARASPSESDQGPVGPSGGCLLTCRRLSLQDLIRVHHSFLRAIDVAMMAGGGTLAKVFLEFKERWVAAPPGCGASGTPGRLSGSSRDSAELTSGFTGRGPLAVCRPRQVAYVRMCMCVCAHTCDSTCPHVHAQAPDLRGVLQPHGACSEHAEPAPRQPGGLQAESGGDSGSRPGPCPAPGLPRPWLIPRGCSSVASCSPTLWEGGDRVVIGLFLFLIF